MCELTLSHYAVTLCFCVYFSLSHIAYVTVCVCLRVSVPVFVFSVSESVCLWGRLYVLVTIFVPPTVPLWLNVILHVSLSVFVILFVWISVFLCLTLCFCSFIFCLSPTLPLWLCVSFYVSVYMSLCIQLCMLFACFFSLFHLTCLTDRMFACLRVCLFLCLWHCVFVSLTLCFCVFFVTFASKKRFLFLITLLIVRNSKFMTNLGQNAIVSEKACLFPGWPTWSRLFKIYDPSWTECKKYFFFFFVCAFHLLVRKFYLSFLALLVIRILKFSTHI